MFAALNSFLTRAVSGYFLNKSLRFRSSASAYLNRTFGTPTNNKKWTWSGWVKRGALGANETIFSSFQNGSNYFDFRFNTSDQLFVQNRVGAVNLLGTNTTAVYRDPSAWYHIMFVFDSDNATAANRNLLYVNGVSVAWLANSGSGDASNFNASGYEHDISGSQTSGLWALFDGEMAEINFVDGQALAPTAFGASSIYNQWLPIRYGGTYGTNGFYLPFSPGTNTSSVSVNYLVVGGGGGGGVYGGGGGGGGGYLTGTLSASPSTPYTVTVGLGGAGAVAYTAKGVSGGGSTFSSITSAGGGGGGSDDGTTINNGADGGSGGGASLSYGQAWSGGASSPVTSPVQGYAGGGVANLGPFFNGGGGGGGASAVGGTGSSVASGGGFGIYGYGTAGNGGAGAASSISGSSVTYAGGGGAGGAGTPAVFPNSYYIAAGSGGSGGGGAGSQGNSVGVAGTTNLGGGGGGGGMYQGAITGGGAGGSGIVIISYAGAQQFSGGTVTTSGGNTIHTFTSSGFLTSIFNDASGNANNWTPNNISLTAGSTYDSLTDVPTLTSATVANYCVLNPLGTAGSTPSSGNLAIASGATIGNRISTFMVTSGKWYWEGIGDGYVGTIIGVQGDQFTGSVSVAGSKSIGYWYSDGLAYWDGGASATGTSYTSSDVIGVALDMTAGNVKFYKNNTLIHDLTFGSGTIPNLSSGVFPGYNIGAATKSVNINFGQQPFTYTAPTGFLPLNTFNI